MLLIFVCLVGIVALYGGYVQLRRMLLKRHILKMSSSFISREDFLGRWKDELSWKEESGCYALFFYRNAPSSPLSYDSVYIGQSERLYRRIWQHLSGKGNAAAKNLIKEGYHVLCCPLPASLWRLNEYEKDLICAFNSTTMGLNKNGGGARRRH